MPQATVLERQQRVARVRERLERSNSFTFFDEYDMAVVIAELNDKIAELEWEKGEFPRYKMLVDDELLWLRIEVARTLYHNGSVHVMIMEDVIERGGTQRQITDDERQQISKTAD